MKYLLACGREIDLNKKTTTKGRTALDISKERSAGLKCSDETEEEFQKAKRNCPKIVELIESFQRNPNETRTKLRKELVYCLPGKFIFLFHIIKNEKIIQKIRSRRRKEEIRRGKEKVGRRKEEN